VWLGTHGMEIGAVSVMLYCFREREQLLNINEMLAASGCFPSYIRIGGLPRGSAARLPRAVKEFLDKFPGKLDEYHKLLDQNHVGSAGRRASASSRANRRWSWGSSGRWRAVGIPYDVAQDVPVPQVRDFRLPGTHAHRRRRVRALSREDGRDAGEREDLPAGP
jgi:NADH-quinone oxidoreductase subunit D